MKKVVFLYFIIGTTFVSAQNEDVNWFFGDSLMMSFTDTGIYSFQTPSKIIHEASASISDSVGNLLFYTDGRYVWNKNHEVMPNGCCLNVDQFGSYSSSITQGALIVPFPEIANLYYIFTLAEDSLCYSIVNLNLDGGNGDIEEKNIFLFSDFLAEKLNGVKHGNGTDWWITIHKRIPGFDPELTNKFYTFLISSSGISGPFEQEAGYEFTFETSVGEMIFSNNGSKIACTGHNFLELFNFDRCTGNITPFALIDNFDIPSFESYGVSFSPDDTKVYVSNGYGNHLYQYCLDCNDSIEDTKTLVFENMFGGYGIGQHEIGPDGKIYFVIAYKIMPNNIFTSRNMNLCVINNPNLEGIACDIDTSTIWLGGRRAIGGLPNMVNYFLGPLIGSECDTIEIDTTISVIDFNSAGQFTVYPNPSSTFIYFNSPFPQHELFDVSIYSIEGKLQLFSGNLSSKYSLDISSLQPGVYSVTIKGQNYQVYNVKLVVVHFGR